MNTTAVPIKNDFSDSLSQARKLTLPSKEAMLRRSHSATQFWKNQALTLEQAWKVWDDSTESSAVTLDDSLLDPALREAVAQAWEDPNKEFGVKALWSEVSDGVYQAQFFDPEKLKRLRRYLDDTAKAGIPVRPPYGIALNRNGAMLDPRSEGYLAVPGFQSFYNELMDTYMRPIARVLFPEVYGFDSQTFGFSIEYRPGVDTHLQPHTDASAVTLNVNMNEPDEAFTGSEVDFFDRASGEVNRISFKPGTALIHRGNVPHTAHTITSGSRSNMVLWLYGENMQLPSKTFNTVQVDAKSRWALPKAKKDSFAPF